MLPYPWKAKDSYIYIPEKIFKAYKLELLNKWGLVLKQPETFDEYLEGIIMGLNIKTITKEELIELEKKYLTGNGELRDLLYLVGIGDGPIDYELRSEIFWAEIQFLNEEIERLGGKKREYIK